MGIFVLLCSQRLTVHGSQKALSTRVWSEWLAGWLDGWMGGWVDGHLGLSVFMCFTVCVVMGPGMRHVSL